MITISTSVYVRLSCHLILDLSFYRCCHPCFDLVDAVMPEVLEGKDKISLEDFLVWTVESSLAQVSYLSHRIIDSILQILQ